MVIELSENWVGGRRGVGGEGGSSWSEIIHMIWNHKYDFGPKLLENVVGTKAKFAT